MSEVPLYHCMVDLINPGFLGSLAEFKNRFFFSSSVLLSSLELNDTKVYEP